jgi:hypothetical protein
MRRSTAHEEAGYRPVLHHTSPGDRSAAETHLKELRRMTGLESGPQTGSRPRAGREASAAAIEASQKADIASVRAEFWSVWCGVHPTKTRLADVGREYREGRA